ncbi:MAG: L,D-transpeptidase family protein [Thomasclavelia ramosa]
MKKMLLNYLDTRNKKIIAGISVFAVILASTLGIYALTKDNLPDFVLNDNKAIKLEYGDKYSVNSMKLLNTEGMDDEDKKILKNGLSIKSNFKYEDGKDYPAIGEYKITMTFNDNTLVKKVKVADTTAPELNTEFRDIDIVKGTDLNTYDFGGLNLFNATDLSPVEVGYDSSAIDSNTIGTYVLKTTAKDSSSNETTKELTVNITEAPNENQELVTETVTNEDGTKSIRNTLKDKATAQDNTANTKSSPNSSKGSSTNKKGSTSSSSSNSSNSSSNVNQSFVANMSISRQTTQAITVVGNGGSYATLTLHTKRNGIWTETLSCSARVGKNGITSSKREGDGKTPTGIYSLGQAFGVAGNPGTSRGWLQVNNNHYWVDDVNSPYYNKLVDASQTGIQWSSAEHLIGYPTAYKYAIAVNYNTACTPGAGSAIFLHCSGSGSTAGCISVSQYNMIKILQIIQSDTLIGIYQSNNNLY